MKKANRESMNLANAFLKKFGSRENLELVCACSRTTVYEWLSGKWLMQEQAIRLCTIVSNVLDGDNTKDALPLILDTVIDKIKEEKGIS